MENSTPSKKRKGGSPPATESTDVEYVLVRYLDCTPRIPVDEYYMIPRDKIDEPDWQFLCLLNGLTNEELSERLQRTVDKEHKQFDLLRTAWSDSGYEFWTWPGSSKLIQTMFRYTVIRPFDTFRLG